MVKKISAPASVSDATIKSETAAPAAADIDAVLKDLNQHAATTAGAAQKTEEKQEQQEIDTVKADILDLLNLAAKAGPLMNWLTPEQFEQLWGRKVREQIAEPLAAIARRNGWDMRGALNDYGPYAMLAAAVGPSAWVTFKVRQQQQAYFREQAAQGAQPAAAGNATDASAST